jgi:hypothetical protein
MAGVDRNPHGEIEGRTLSRHGRSFRPEARGVSCPRPSVRDHVSGLGAYEQVLRPAMLQNQRIGPAVIKTVIPRSGVQLWAMTQAMRSLPRWQSSPSATHLFGVFDLDSLSSAMRLRTSQRSTAGRGAAGCS